MNVLEWAVSSVLGSPNSQAGAIDVIAVRKSDGSLSCSPFHVKLGKSSKKGERRVVNLKVNGKDVDLSMKLGPAGEAFFVERSRDFGRRDGTTPYPGSPFHLGNSSYEELLSPREEPGALSPLPVPSFISVTAVKSKENLQSLVVAPSPVVAPQQQQQQRIRPRSLSESEVSAKPTTLEDFLRASSSKKLTCVTEFSGDVSPASTNDAAGEVTESPTGSTDNCADAEGSAAPAPESAEAPSRAKGRRERSASDMSELVGASQRAARAVDLLGSISARSSTSSLDADATAADASDAESTAPNATDGQRKRTTAPQFSAGAEGAVESPEGDDTPTAAAAAAAGTNPAPPQDALATVATAPEQQEGLGAAAAAPKEESAVSWIWRWGYLPVKTKAKSSTDLEGLTGLPTTSATVATVTAAANATTTTTAAGGGENESCDLSASAMEPAHSATQAAAVVTTPTVTATATVTAAAASTEAQGLRDSRGRAVSLPSMFPAMNDDGAGTHVKAGRRMSTREGGVFIDLHSKIPHHLLHGGDLHDDCSGDGGLMVMEVTAVEGRLAGLDSDGTSAVAGDTAGEGANVDDAVASADFADMFQAAVRDTSRFRALSLCGHLLSSSGRSNATSGGQEGERFPTSRQELMRVLDAHRISPKDIAVSPKLPPPQAGAEAQPGKSDGTDSKTEIAAAVFPAAAAPTVDQDNSILKSAHLVVILDDFLLPIAAAEKLLVRSACVKTKTSEHHTTTHTSAADAAAGGGGDADAEPVNTADVSETTCGSSSSSSSRSDAHITDIEVAAVLVELSSELRTADAHASLPVWAGRRISLWGRECAEVGDSIGGCGANTANENVNNKINKTQVTGEVTKLTTATTANATADDTTTFCADERNDGDGPTPLGHLTWQESFSDLVQAYRVRNILSIHSLHVSGGASTSNSNNSGRDSYVTSPLLQEFISPGGKHPVSYRELWRRQQQLCKSGSFTALLTPDACRSASAEGKADKEDRWASSDDASDGYGVGYSLHPDRLSDSSLAALAAIEEAREGEKMSQAPVTEGAAVTEAGAVTLAEESTQPATPSSARTPMPSFVAAGADNKDIPARPLLSPTATTASYMRDAPIRSLHHHDPFNTTSTTAAAGTEEGGSSQPSLLDEGDTDNDNVSLHDIDLEDISPEPAGGDFYESDTDSYLSLSLEDGEAGSVYSGKSGSFSTGGGGGGSAGIAATEGGFTRRRFKRYRYRKVLVPSQEQLDLLDLKDGPNEIVFELAGCAPLKSCLFVWPADAKVVVTDLDGVFSKKQNARAGGGVWINFLGGGSYYSAAAASKTEFDSCIRLFRGLHSQGYRVIYLAQGSLSATTATALLSSQDYLSSIKTSTGECLPAGPVFKSPESLVRAFGAARTEVFKASALRGVKSLFPPTHNPYHACFCNPESESIPFARFGFPEGRIFSVSENGDLKSANRTCVLTFPRLNELLHQIFPLVVDSQSQDQIIGGSAKTSTSAQSSKTACTPLTNITSAEEVGGFSGKSTGSSSAFVGNSPAASTTAATTVTTTAATAAVVVTSLPSSERAKAKGKAVSFSQLRAGTEDTYNDFNYWKIPPAIIEDDYY